MSDIDTTKVQDSDIIPVRNLTNFKVTYTLPNGVRREFPPKGVLKITAEELRSLNYDLGGSNLLIQYLNVGNKSLAAEFGVSTDSWDNEYNWTDKDIQKCLLEDDIEVLEDALDFAPQGVCDAIIGMAVELEIPDVRKREVIFNKTGNDITNKIKNKHLVEKESGAAEAEKPARRRKTATTSSRRVTK